MTNVKPTILIWMFSTPKVVKPVSVTDTVSVVRMRKVYELKSSLLLLKLILMDGVSKISMVRLNDSPPVYISFSSSCLYFFLLLSSLKTE